MSLETRAATWFKRARQVTPGGVHSPVRAFASVGTPPLAIVEAHGAEVRDVEGRTYIDYIGAWGPALLGHAQPDVQAAVVAAAARGLVFGLASPPEVDLAERLVARVPGCEMVRFTVSGTEATMSAVRVARAATGRRVVMKFAGGYHGHGDMFLVSAGSGMATLGIPDSPGVPSATAADTAVAQFNDLDSVDRAIEAAAGDVAAIIVEPVVGNMGCVAPEAGFLDGLRERCTGHGIVLIFDEVMCGFRVARGGAAERYGVTPDLITLGKVIGGGMPLAAFGGRRDLMNRVAPAGPVYQAGTYAAHPLSVAAGLAMLDALDARPDLYDMLERAGARLEQGLRDAAAAADVPVSVQRVGSMWTVFFSASPVRSWDDASAVDRAAHGRFFRGMLTRGVLLPPSAFESAFLSAAHDAGTIDQTIEAARAAFQGVPRMNDRFLRACRRQPVDRTPFWMMRQAGRYLPEYRAVRAEVDFLTLCKTPELAVEVSLQPLRRFALDAAIIFSDILLPLEALGCRMTFNPSPKIAEPIRTRAQVDALVPRPAAEVVPFVGDALTLLRRELDGKTPVIGFCGAPFTLAAYLVQGEGKDGFGALKKLLYSDPATVEALLEMLTLTMIDYLRLQIAAGAQAVQVFDSWSGILDPVSYERFALRWVRAIVRGVAGLGVPVIYFVNGSPHLLEAAAASGADVLGVCWRTPIEQAAARIGSRLAIQGNLDPHALFAAPEVVKELASDILTRMEGRPGHIMNLGHGILPETPIASVHALLEAVAATEGKSAVPAPQP